MDRRDFLGNAAKTVITGAFLWEGWMSYQYADIFGFDQDYQVGRTKNSIAALVAGLVGQQAYGNSRIDMEVQKLSWPDASLTGYTTETSIDTNVDLLFTSARFQAEKNGQGALKGEVKKSEFNWAVEQEGEDRYVIGRFGPKFDGVLELHVRDGIISGEYARRGPHFNWKIEGTYDDQGNVRISIDDLTTAGVNLVGVITPR